MKRLVRVTSVMKRLSLLSISAHYIWKPETPENFVNAAQLSPGKLVLLANSQHYKMTVNSDTEFQYSSILVY